MVYYEPGVTPHGLPRNPFKACVVPRPIGWISTRSADGKDNLAPYSQFNNLTFDPPYVMFSANQTHTNSRKDTTINAETTGSFAWNICTWDLRHAMNITSEQLPYGTDEFQAAELAYSLRMHVLYDAAAAGESADGNGRCGDWTGGGCAYRGRGADGGVGGFAEGEARGEVWVS
ncbi:FMN-binding split barrel protein [Rutstroemia sp. NJR-2017a BBW]|nr:FMN-binding split barrel protein [Rutstroemia sp. NJR-2017a BBW]